MKASRAQIVATIGPASDKKEVLKSMIEHGLDVARLNFSWSNFELRIKEIDLIRELEREIGKKVPIIIDLPGPRLQEEKGHTYDRGVHSAITAKDREFISFAVEHGADYVAVSFVASPRDVEEARKIVEDAGGKQKIIAKIERKTALVHLDKIIESADAVMVARGDLGNEIPLEEIPFVQERIIKKSKEEGKPVITATGMLLSMVENPVPSRAEVTDVTNAILEGSDAVMLSEETAIGKHPLEAVIEMEKIVLESEKHLRGKKIFHSL